MTALKRYITGIVIGTLLGRLIGVNIGKERMLFANPFSEPTFTQ